MTSDSSTEQLGPSRAGLLVVVAVRAEADAVLRGLRDGARPVPVPGAELWRGEHDCGVPVDVLVGGVGPAAVAAATANVLARHRYELVVSAGIAGGFVPHAPIGSVVVAEEIVAADLGAETPTGFEDVARLGFGTVRHTPSPAAVALAAEALGATAGTVLTVSTVTGSAERAAELAARHPGAAAEAMEGFGVAEAAALNGLPVFEIRAVSNAVGPRDRSAWRIGEALGALERAFRTLPYPELLQEVTHG
ncbi:futalosine hydrolase [Kitasatospora sp. MAP5-34]|uniref:futalosine hydrolase n=1 Tax=Kitasatospora sp. MAP5-34 TaxID=3035102 RepID=UPI002474B451|nr:futalosine hydrolase [Kitasatospora sp. MAP5-34]MDH6577588.1 futalosine hydrolase [Kitasatospora sp. MAP5-34]